MNPTIPPNLKSAYADCQKIAASHYENFPVASLLLPQESRPHIAALYAFARTADDFADEDQYQGRRIQKLSHWEKGLRAAMKNKKSPALLQAFANTLKLFQIPISLPLNLLKAYRMDLVKKRYRTWGELLYYCRHSANPVGRMVLSISGVQEPNLHRYSDFICTGLQLINFWQDTSVDLARNRIYYPQTELKKARIGEKSLLHQVDSPAFRILVKNVVDYTETYFQKGYPLLEKISGRLRWELRATYWGGQGILDKIRGMDYNVLKVRPKWTPLDKISLMIKTLVGGTTL